MHPVVLVIPKAHVFRHTDVGLTAIDIDILYWLAHGFTMAQVSLKIFRSYRCTHEHISHMCDITGYCNHAGLVAFAFLHKVLWEENREVRKWEKSDEP